MNVSEYIACLEKLKAEHGDLKVVSRSSYGVMGAFRFTGEPRLAEEAVLKPRETSRRLVSGIERDATRHSGVFYVEV